MRLINSENLNTIVKEGCTRQNKLKKRTASWRIIARKDSITSKRKGLTTTTTRARSSFTNLEDRKAK